MLQVSLSPRAHPPHLYKHTPTHACSHEHRNTQLYTHMCSHMCTHTYTCTQMRVLALHEFSFCSRQYLITTGSIIHVCLSNSFCPAFILSTLWASESTILCHLLFQQQLCVSAWLYHQMGEIQKESRKEVVTVPCPNPAYTSN